MRRKWGILFLLPTACITSGDSGTSVGNPGKVRMSIGASENYELARASVAVDTVHLENCQGEQAVVSVDDTVNLLEPESVDLPSGTWCAIQLMTTEPLQIQGNFFPEDGDEDDAPSFELAIDLSEDIWLDGEGFSVDNRSFVMEIGHPGWLESASFEPEDGQIIDAEDAISEQLFEVLEQNSNLFEDINDDGEIDEEERELEPVATNEEPNDDDIDEEEDDSTDSGDLASGTTRGCHTMASSKWTNGSWPILWIGILIAIRQRGAKADV